MPVEERVNAWGRLRTLTQAVRLVASASGRSLWIAVVVQLVGGFIAGATIWSVGRVIAGLTGDVPDWAATWPWIVVLAVLTTIAGLLAAIGREQQALLGELVHRRTAERVIETSATVPFDRFDFGGFYDRMARAIGGAGGSASSIVFGTLGATRSLIDAVFIVIVLLTAAPVVIPIAIAAYIPLTISSRLGNRHFHRFLWDQTATDRRRSYLASLFGQRDAGREVRMFALGDTFGSWHTRLWDERVGALRSLIRIRLTHAAIGSFVASLMTALALGLIAWLASRDELSLPNAGVGILAVHRLSTAARQLNGHLAALDRGGRQMRDYDRFIAEAEAEAEQSAGDDVPQRIERVDVTDLHFTYPNATTFALRGIDLTLRPGEVTAIVGPNGSGKSTLMMLLCGLYSASQGEIRWNGRRVDEFHPDSFRRSIATMFQDFTRYRLPARHNLTIADIENADDDTQIRRVAEQAGAGDVLDRLDRGLDTELSPQWEAGTELSAGEWQRIAAARALFRDAPLVILDEPTADLDALAERKLIDELAATASDRCVLFISHRFSAIRVADRIVVLSDGRIVGDGTHDDLLSDCDLYSTMYRTQTGHEV